MRAVFEDAAPASTPVCLRLDLWHRDTASRGTLPEPLVGCSVAEIEDRLGFCRSARWRASSSGLSRWLGPGDRGGPGTAHRLPFSRRTLEKVERRTPDQTRAGMRGTAVQYPVTNETEGRALLAALEQAALAAAGDAP